MSMLRTLLQFIILILSFIGSAQNNSNTQENNPSQNREVIRLSDSNQVSLLTASPGAELYTAFGHTGIRFVDYKNDFDVVFNYGTFDFDQPGFYTNFVKGKMLYMISGSSFDYFMEEYVIEKRSVREQEIALPTRDKQRLFDFLYNNALPENREYYYDFFWDNCATRPRDVFEKVLGDRLQYRIDTANFENNKTMHDMLRLYVGKNYWVDYGFDLILGLPCEITATPRNQTFLPDYVSKYMASAYVDGHPLVTSEKFLLKYPLPEIESTFRPMHLNLLLLLFVFLIWLLERKNKTHFFGLDFAIFFTMGLLGTFFLSLWFFTSHYSVPKNLNLLWLVPSHLFVAYLLLRRRKPKWLKFYFMVTAILMALILIFWKLLPQPFNPAVMPLIILLGFRSTLIVLQLNRNQKNT